MEEKWKGKLEKIDNYRWRIPKDYKEGMRVPGIIYAHKKMLDDIVSDQAPEQVANVAFLPGIVRNSLAMPDIHWGYGFPIGGVAATDVRSGVISPGGIGFDINCGVRLLRTDLIAEDIKPRMADIVEALFNNIPTGVGKGGKLKVDHKELSSVILKGARWAVEHGYGTKEDLELTEAGGAMEGANPDEVSEKAIKRSRDQLGTLGSGNHFLEVQVVEEVYYPEAADIFGIFPGGITVMIHTGSRGFGHQITTDFLDILGRVSKKYDINLPDRQLACAPVDSPEGRSYFGAMAAGANFAWANRQCITHWIREVFEQVFKQSSSSLGIRQVYDVAHNIAKIEKHKINGRELTVCVHRKGATRAFAPGHPEIPAKHRETGQAVIIPGDMGRYSFLAVGTEKAMEETFGSACHGAGRRLSRSKAKKIAKGKNLRQEMKDYGVIVRATGWDTIAEEMPEAYKNVEDVVDSTTGAGITRLVAKMRPLGVIKG
ncbi:MAG TPA: RtcB family protein [Candidatus Eremiobacteraeota bacterium]|nr:RtcB family protein [Candidatus Eremiobacteraeota bacterium]